MRDLSAFAAIPKPAQLREGIPDPDRFRPEPRLVRPVEIRPRPDGFGDLHLPGQPPQRIHPMVIEAYRGLEAGLPFDAIVERAAPLWEGRKPKMVARVLRSYMLELSKIGVVELPFEAPPDLFGGRFRRLRTLGRGGMGVVHLCQDETSGREVVLKHSWGWSSRIELAELYNRREAAALSVVDHPLIPRLVTTFEEGGILHIVREFAEGDLLQSSANRGLPVDARLRAARDICDAIGHVHESGMIYLDVKPENFVRSSLDGRSRLIDMGLCRPCLPTGARLHGPAGSRGYAAPEVVTRFEADEQADLYSIGRVMFFLATGLRPRTKWTAALLHEKMRAAGCPTEEADLARDLAAEPKAERVASAADALKRLDRALEGGLGHDSA